MVETFSSASWLALVIGAIFQLVVGPALIGSDFREQFVIAGVILGIGSGLLGMMVIVMKSNGSWPTRDDCCERKPLISSNVAM